jgi:hypothetical protein
LAGSIPGALINIAAASGAASSEAEQKIERLVPLTPQQSAQSVAIGLAIQELQDRDLDKINKAIETLNVVLKKSVEPSNDFKTAKQRLIEMWKKTDLTPENIKIFTDVLQGVGILPK